MSDSDYRGVPVTINNKLHWFAGFADDAEIFDFCVVLKPGAIWVASKARIDSFVKLEGGNGLHIGKGVHVASLAHVNIGGGEVSLGDYAAVASGAKILGGSNMKEGVSMSAAAPPEMQAVHRGVTLIGANAFVGVNAVVRYDVTIGEGAVIGAGAVVTRDVPAREIWAGVPARKIGER